MAEKQQKMTARERAFYEQKRRKENEVRRRKRSAFGKYAARVGIMAAGAAVLFGIVLASALKINFSSSPEKYEYSLKIIADGKETQTENGIKVYDNICYIPLSSVADLLGCSIMGDVYRMSAVFPDGDITFDLDTDICLVNGIARNTGGASFLTGSDGEVYVPIDFFIGAFDGVELVGVKDKRKISYTLSVSSEYSLAFDGYVPENQPDMTGLFEQAVPVNDFITDLSEYEQYMNPENPDEYITLINTSHTLSADYIPDDLTEISYTRRDGRATQKMRLAAAKSLDAMFIEMKANGFSDVSVTSAYRSYAYQQELFDNKLSYYKRYYDYNTAYAKTASENAIPGTSEHQSGLCADLHNLSSASQAFEAEDAYDWLVAHCADFGFILRYPKDKQDITNIIYEPWHYRFVGRYHAQKIMQSGLCLEEYCEQNNIGLN